MTAIDLDELERLLAAATPGPWEAHEIDEDPPFSFLVGAGSLPPERRTVVGESAEDHAFICAARNHMGDLIARIRELKADLLRIAHATGVVNEPDGRACTPGPIDAIVSAIADGVRSERLLAELEAENRWIPVGERLPDSDRWVLCWDGNANGVMHGYYLNGDWYTNKIAPEACTHWRELPKGPE